MQQVIKEHLILIVLTISRLKFSREMVYDVLLDEGSSDVSITDVV